MYNHLLFQYLYYYQSSFHVLIMFHLFIQSFTHSLNTCMQLFIVSASSVLLLLFIYFIIIHYYTYIVIIYSLFQCSRTWNVRAWPPRRTPVTIR